MTGRELLRIRERLGYSQRRLAALLRTTDATVCRWENGLNPISPAMAEYIRMKTAVAVPQAAAVAV